MTDLIEGFDVDTDLLLTEQEMHTFSGRHAVFPHHEVLTTDKCIQITGVLPKIKEWRDEDRAGRHPGGPAPYVDDRTILVVLLLLAREHAPLNETAIAEVMHRRLTKESRDFLGIPQALPPKNPEKGGTEEKNWQNHAYNAFQRILDTMDPHLDTKGNRRRLLNNAERQAILTARDLNTMRRKKDRLDWFSQQLLQMTFTMQPRRLRRRQRVANISVDQTPVPVYTKRGTRKNQQTGEEYERLVKEMDAAWYKKPDDYVWGFAANFAVSCGSNLGEETDFPITIRAFTLSVPNVDIPGEAVKLGQQLLNAGHSAGRFSVDRGYSSNSSVDQFHKPVRNMGYQPVFDFTKRELGEKEGGQNGSIYVEGAHLCPGTPEELINASIRANELEFDEKTYRALIQERSLYELRNKEAPDVSGKVKKMCPALGKQAKIECPLREIHPESSEKPKPRVLKRNVPTKPDKICCNTSATFVENDETIKSKQHLRYGSREWATVYQADRNMVEGMNGYIKDEHAENLASAGRRSASGLAAQQVLVTMLIVSANMRKLQSFLKREAQEAIKTIKAIYPRSRRRDFAGWGTYKRKWGPKHESIYVPGRDQPLEITALRT